MDTCEINMKLPSLNDYVALCRENRYKSASFKKKIERDIGLFIRVLPRYDCPVVVHFHWIEQNMRRDADNIAFAKKFILDSLVKHGKLVDDSRRYVVGFTDSFESGGETKVIIQIERINKHEKRNTG